MGAEAETALSSGRRAPGRGWTGGEALTGLTRELCWEGLHARMDGMTPTNQEEIIPYP